MRSVVRRPRKRVKKSTSPLPAMVASAIRAATTPAIHAASRSISSRKYGCQAQNPHIRKPPWTNDTIMNSRTGRFRHPNSRLARSTLRISAGRVDGVASRTAPSRP